jgi:ribosomal protein L31E
MAEEKKAKKEEIKEEKKKEKAKKEAKPEKGKPEIKEAKAEKKEKEKPEKEESKKKEEKKDKASAAVAKPAEGRVFTIPLRKAFRKSASRKKNYAIALIRDFLTRHAKGDEIKLGSELHKLIWEKGNPPRRIRVKAVSEGPVIKAELLGFEYKDFKAIPKKETKGMKDRLLGRLGPKAIKKEEEEKMIKEKIKPEKPEKFERHETAEE